MFLTTSDAVILHVRVCEGGGPQLLWRTYTGTQPETADTAKGSLRSRPVLSYSEFVFIGCDKHVGTIGSCDH